MFTCSCMYSSKAESNKPLLLQSSWKPSGGLVLFFFCSFQYDKEAKAREAGERHFHNSHIHLQIQTDGTYGLLNLDVTRPCCHANVSRFAFYSSKTMNLQCDDFICQTVKIQYDQFEFVKSENKYLVVSVKCQDAQVNVKPFASLYTRLLLRETPWKN